MMFPEKKEVKTQRVKRKRKFERQKANFNITISPLTHQARQILQDWPIVGKPFVEMLERRKRDGVMDFFEDDDGDLIFFASQTKLGNPECCSHSEFQSTHDAMISNYQLLLRN